MLLALALIAPLAAAQESGSTAAQKPGGAATPDAPESGSAATPGSESTAAPESVSAAPPESKSWWRKSLDAVNYTTPDALATKDAQGEDRGWFSGTWDGTKRIWRDGKYDVYLSGYTWHMPFAYTKQQRLQENHNTFGLGFGKTLTDERDNQYSLYGLVFSDSHYKPEYNLGYAWVARWRVVDGVRVGAGYTLALVSRSDINNYVPFPAVAPLLSIGNNTFTVFGTYIPGSASVAYFFGRISFDVK